MSVTQIWHDIGAGETFLNKFLRFLFLIVALVVFYFFATLPLTWPQQAVLGLLTVLLAIWIDRSSNSYLVTLALMLCSVYSTFRYGYWNDGRFCGAFLPASSGWASVPNILGRPKRPVIVVDRG